MIHFAKRWFGIAAEISNGQNGTQISIKTGLSRTRLSHLMDAETWMNANKALELGFCDEIMFRREEAEADAEDSFLYSSRAVTNCLLNKLKAHAPKPEPRVKASDLEKRLALLKY